MFWIMSSLTVHRNDPVVDPTLSVKLARQPWASSTHDQRKRDSDSTVSNSTDCERKNWRTTHIKAVSIISNWDQTEKSFQSRSYFSICIYHAYRTKVCHSQGTGGLWLLKFRVWIWNTKIDIKGRKKMKRDFREYICIRDLPGSAVRFSRDESVRTRVGNINESKWRMRSLGHDVYWEWGSLCLGTQTKESNPLVLLRFEIVSGSFEWWDSQFSWTRLSF